MLRPLPTIVTGPGKAARAASHTQPLARSGRSQRSRRTPLYEMLEILFQIDPIGVREPDTTEKLVPEAASILARLRDARSAEDVE